MEMQSYAPLAMPIGVEQVRFYRTQPAAGEDFECHIRIAKLDEHNCWSNQQLIDPTGRIAVEMLGWHTRRYQMKAYFFHRVREVEVRLLSEAIGGLFVIFVDQDDTANMREYLALRSPKAFAIDEQGNGRFVDHARDTFESQFSDDQGDTRFATRRRSKAAG